MPRVAPTRIDLEGAETLALQVLTFLLGDPKRLSRFTALTGVDLAEIRAAADSPSMLAAVLEYLLSDESLLLMFCQGAGVAPETIGPAQDLLAKHSG